MGGDGLKNLRSIIVTLDNPAGTTLVGKGRYVSPVPGQGEANRKLLSGQSSKRGTGPILW